MRLQGIGPYAEAQDVDMDRLNDAGLFLLDGPTGAGKSTVLAALCYALYGSVPGGRSPESLVTTLRPPGAVVPEVLVEFTVQGRRFEVVRSPRHERLKKRRSASGKDTTPTPAAVSLREHVDGAWQEPLTRNDEVGVQVADVMHLDAAQFMQVVMLPQGRFAEFLTARSDERQRLLRRLFGTQRFDGVEEHLKTEAERLGSRAAADAQVAAAAREQLREAVAAELGEDWHAPEPFPVTDEELVERTAERTREAVGAARAGRDAAAAEEAAARGAQAELRATGEALAAAAAWTERERAHREGAEAAAGDRTAVAAHERAGRVLGAADRAESARAAEDRAREADGTAQAAAAEDLLAAGWLEQARRDAAETPADDAALPRDAVALAERAVEEVARAVRDRAAAERLEETERTEAARRTQMDAEREAAEAARSGREESLAAVREAVEAASARLGAQADVDRRVAEAEQGLAAAREAERHALAADAAVLSREAARTGRDAAAQHRLGLLRSRYEQAAADLAADLEDGTPCAVCGSPEHPDPAPRVGTAVIEADVAAAEEALAAAEAVLADAETARTAAHERVRASAAAAGGRTPAQAEEALAAARTEHAELAAVRKALAADRRRLQALETERDEAAAAETARTAEDARLQEASRQRHERLLELRAGIERARGDAPDLDARGALVRTARGRLEALAGAVEARERALAVAADADRALAAALREQEFEDVGAARAARLTAEDAAARTARVRAWDDEQARLAELAQSDAVRRGRELQDQQATAPTPEDLEAAAARLLEAERSRRERDEALGRRTAVAAAVERQAALLRGVLDRSAALLAEHERVTGLLALVRGGGENRLKMPLASYVLAGRLEEVAAAATERLLAMTDGRYSIEYSDDSAGRGNKGLELVVRDHYVDETRHPSTLSGGETFMASLALALGLADTVQAEAGGVELDTLFVDEGFGSLDSDTLDDVLDVVDGLRSGGRTVGLVSHVERMKQEIPVRLAVTKEREGSSLAVHVDA
ncbi:SMC family ATPase [Micrococcus endophyticus]|uniref:SMC family ATPase n=1 Tax=Micrococcus endophyticus TaxID=455343 RepID=UPI0031CE917D